MKKRWLLLALIPMAFTLSGCSHIRKTKVKNNSFYNNEIVGKTFKKKIYYNVNGDSKIKSQKVEDHTFDLEIPRSLKKQTVKISVNPNLNSPEEVTIPSSKGIINWKDFCNDFNDFQSIESITDKNEYKINPKYKNITNGQGRIEFQDCYLKYNIANSKIIALSLTIRTVDGYEDLGYLGLKEYKGTIESLIGALSSGGNTTSTDNLTSHIKNQFSRNYDKTGQFSGNNFRLIQIPGQISFDVWKK